MSWCVYRLSGVVWLGVRACMSGVGWVRVWQVLLWEKKIALEKETQEALDPEYGQAEVAGAQGPLSANPSALCSLSCSPALSCSPVFSYVHICVELFCGPCSVWCCVVVFFAPGMKKEIHRMQLRFQQLKRKQEDMIQEMERTIEKKDSIEAKSEKFFFWSSEIIAFAFPFPQQALDHQEQGRHSGDHATAHYGDSAGAEAGPTRAQKRGR